MAKLEAGQSVKCNLLLLGGSDTSAHVWRWCGGYAFVRYENEHTALVRHVGGTFDGCVSRHPVSCIQGA